MTYDVKITGINIINGRPWAHGDGFRFLAHFDCEVGGIAIRGCTLHRTEVGGLVAGLPKLSTARGELRIGALHIVDEALRHGMMSVAREAYISFGGKGAEWVSSREASDA